MNLVEELRKEGIEIGVKKGLKKGLHKSLDKPKDLLLLLLNMNAPDLLPEYKSTILSVSTMEDFERLEEEVTTRILLRRDQQA